MEKIKWFFVFGLLVSFAYWIDGDNRKALYGIIFSGSLLAIYGMKIINKHK